jgi:hypothetical protein
MVDMMTATTTLELGWQQFVAILGLTFGLILLLAGIFTAYFGSGKSRTIGIVLLVVGIAVGLLTGYWYHILPESLGTLVWQTFLVLIAAIIGAIVAVAIFLVAIMKS